MNYLVDANILSEATKPAPDPQVVAWLRSHESQLVVSPIILGELEYGILTLPKGQRRTRLEKWFAQGVRRIQSLDVDADTASHWANLLASLKRNGHAMPVKDSLIAATALAHGLTVRLAMPKTSGSPVSRWSTPLAKAESLPMPLLPPLTQIPPEVASLEDYERLARERLTDHAWAYYYGGAGDEITVRRNREAFTELALAPRVLAPMTGGHTRISLLGHEYDHPIFLAPIAYHRMAHPDGEVATALGASALKAGMILSTHASMLLEQVAAAAQAPLWYQLYLQPDRGFIRELLQRVAAAGYRAIVLTVDAPLKGLRNREHHALFKLPPGIEAVNLKGMKSLPPVYAQPGAPPSISVRTSMPPSPGRTSPGYRKTPTSPSS
nr:alpha-hydroxy-acid oxidizing protein [Verrucomicrobium spinosum]